MTNPNFAGLKKKAEKRRKLDDPPSREEARGNLEQPEHAPAAPLEPPPPKPKTIRTAPLGLKISQAHRKKIKVLALSEGDKEAGIIEKAIDLYFSQKENNLEI